MIFRYALTNKVVKLIEQHQATPKEILEVTYAMAEWLGDMGVVLSDDEFDDLIKKVTYNIEQLARGYRRLHAS